MAQNLEWFEQDCPQSPVLPGGFLDASLEQAALFGPGLLKEKFTRPTGQTEHIDSLINRGRGPTTLIRRSEQSMHFFVIGDLDRVTIAVKSDVTVKDS